jgi:Capsule polysaccharide biosynthesis protein
VNTEANSMSKSFSHSIRHLRSAIARKVLPRIIFYAAQAHLLPQEFVRSAQTFVKFLEDAHLVQDNLTSNPDAEVVGVAIIPWVSTAVPWYSITIAIGLAQRGKNVVLIWDDCCFPDPSVALKLQNLCISYVLNYLGRFFPIIRLSSEQSLPNSIQDQQYLHKLADLNLIWYSRAGSLGKQNSNDLDIYKHKLSQILPLIRNLYSRIKFEYLIVPGGIYGSSSLFASLAQEIGLRVATYDGGMGCLFCCSDGIAAQQLDIPVAFAKLGNSNIEVKDQAIAKAKQEFQSRIECKDEFRFQISPLSLQKESIACDVLIPLNIEWDSAALGKHYIFEDTIDWLLRTISFILANSNKHIVVRQHPGERLASGQSYLDLESLLSKSFGNHEKLRFVSATQEINTYQLLESATLVLPFASTIGLEAAAMGKSVIISGAVYYKDLGFVWSASSQQEYFDILLKALHNSLPILDHQPDKAWLCYYLTQLCNLTFTHFNPELQGFWHWGRQNPQELFSDPVVADLLTAIDTNAPFAWLRHCRNLKPLVE